MREEKDVHPAPQQRFERGEELCEFLREHDVAFAVAEVLDARLVRLLADVIDEQLLKPIDGIENERLEVVRFGGERGDPRDDIGPCLRRGQTRHVEVMRAALGIEEDGRGKLRGERGLTDAFGTENHGFLWPGDSPGEDLEFGHDGLRFVPRGLDVPPAPNGAALPEVKTSCVSRYDRLP